MVRLAPAPPSTCSGLLALLSAIGTRLASIRDGGTWAIADAVFVFWLFAVRDAALMHCFAFARQPRRVVATTLLYLALLYGLLPWLLKAFGAPALASLLLPFSIAYSGPNTAAAARAGTHCREHRRLALAAPVRTPSDAAAVRTIERNRSVPCFPVQWMNEVFLMGLSDRDYMRKKGTDARLKDVHYNPKLFRKNRAHKPPVIERGVAGKKMFMSVLAWIIVAVVLMAIFNRYAPSRRPALPATAMAPLKGPFDSCEPLPPSGSHLVIDPAVMRRTDVLYSGLELQNLHRYPVVVVLTNSGGEARYQSVSLASGANVQVGVPVGRYGLQVLTGANWCNLDSGFSDGAKVRMNGGVSIRAGTTTNMQLRSTGTRPEQFSVTYRTTGPIGAARP